MQWRIQDFSDEETPTAKAGAPTYFLDMFPHCKDRNNLDPEGGRAWRPWMYGLKSFTLP